MSRSEETKLVREVLGSATVFSSTLDDVLEAELRELTDEAITLSQVKLLSLLARGEQYMVSDVAGFLRVSNAAASRAVDRLVQRELVTRTESARDRRAVDLRLTQKARHLLARFRTATDELIEEVLSQFPAEEMRQAADLLDRMSVALLSAELEEHDDPETVCFRCSIYFRETCLMRRLVGRRCMYTDEAPDVGQPAL